MIHIIPGITDRDTKRTLQDIRKHTVSVITDTINTLKQYYQKGWLGKDDWLAYNRQMEGYKEEIQKLWRDDVQTKVRKSNCYLRRRYHDY